MTRLLGAALMVLLVSSCASASGPGHPRTHRTVPVSNRLRTQDETRRLLTLAPLPPRRAALAHAGALAGPPEPVTTALADTTEAWRVPMSLAASLAWAQANPPSGLRYGGSFNSASSGTVTSSGLSYSAPDSRYWTGAELEVTLVPAGPSTTDWRIDGTAEWLDTKPEPDTETGLRIHVSAATGCPRSDRGVVGVTNAGDDLRQALLPAALPNGALICSYEGLNGHPFRLLMRRTISPARARALAATVRSLSLSHVDGAVSSCASGMGTATVIAFAYPGRTVDLWYQGSGCPSVANGAIAAGSLGGSIGPLINAIRAISGGK